MARNGTETVLLQPRQYARYPGKLLLLPLLPVRAPVKPLPIEIWRDIFFFAAAGSGSEATAWPLSYLMICKSLKVMLTAYSSMTIIESYFEGHRSTESLFPSYLSLHRDSR